MSELELLEPVDLKEEISREEAVEALIRHGVRHALGAIKLSFQRVIALQTVRGTPGGHQPLLGVLQALVDNEPAFIEQIVGVAAEELRHG